MGHLQSKGFRVKIMDTSYDELNAVKDKYGIPRRLRSCHTGFVGKYIVEGHVPAEIVLRLLAERPDVAGIGVPGMPIGSPGMPGPNPRPYDVFSFDRNGRVKFYARVTP